MAQEQFEVRTIENIKVGDLGVCGNNLVLIVKHHHNTGFITLEDIVQQIVGDDLGVEIVVYGDLSDWNRRIEVVKAKREILRLPE